LEKLKFSNHQTHSQTIGDTMNKKTIYAIVAVIVVVLVVGIAGYILLYGNLGNGGGTTPTPTPTPDTIVGASTVQFSVNETTNGATVIYNFACKNYNTSTELIRVDIPSDTGNYSYILNAGEQKSWSNVDGTWTQDSAFDPGSFAMAFTNYANKLADQGNINDLTYTADGNTYIIYCVAVNLPIADSTFEPT
jgi:hypothetical protein